PADYSASLQLLASYGDYVAVNVSSPNTPNLRELQDRRPLTELLRVLGKQLDGMPGQRLPLFLKLAPDLSDTAFDEVLQLAGEIPLHGLIVCNTTIDHTSVPADQRQTGGLSGAPLRDRSTALIARAFRAFLSRPASERPVIVGVGGIFSGVDALQKIEAGATLVQVYTGYVYHGPDLPRQINRHLDQVLIERGCSYIDLVGSSAR